MYLYTCYYIRNREDKSCLLCVKVEPFSGPLVIKNVHQRAKERAKKNPFKSNEIIYIISTKKKLIIGKIAREKKKKREKK
jgi:hypothetical protein